MCAIGKTLSHYRILEDFGSCLLRIYRAHDERLNRDVVLKVFPARSLDETARRHFRREVLALSQLNHLNIATVYDFDSQSGIDFLVRDFVEGETLAARVARGPVAEKEVIALGTQIAKALECAHEHGIIHRDLKPANVIVTAKGHAKVFYDVLATPPGHTNAVVGTIPYMSPEQLQGKPADARVDIYGLGTILYELATGRRPFPGKQLSAVAAAILAQSPQPPRELNGEVSPGLEAIILKALRKNPDERYQSPKEILEDLGRLSAPGRALMQKMNISE